MNVLLLCQAYPPRPIVGAFRPHRIARAFRDAGHKVMVVTERLPDELEALRPTDPGIEVLPVEVGPKYRERVAGMLARFRRKQPYNGSLEASGSSGGEPARRSVTADIPPRPSLHPRERRERSVLERFALAMLWLPDDEQRFIRPALRATRTLLPKADLIYSTAPAWSMHVAALLLRRRSGIRWVADFRDPWLEVVEEREDHPRTALTDRILRGLERAVLREADYVVAVAEKTRLALADKVPPAERSKFLLARNGIDSVSPARTDREPGPFRIVYTGSFYDSRDPRVFLRALALLRERMTITPQTLRVEFAGACRVIGSHSVEDLVVQLGLADVVHFHDWMSRDEAAHLLRRADLLLVLARGMRLQVPNKLYEYLGMRLPIFAWADEDGETAAVLRAIDGHFVVTSADVEDMAGALQRALAASQSAIDSPVQEQLLKEWGAERQMRQLVSAVVA